jgi:uncharacterized surface protein with fasciclin (FAS1) repeats
MNKLALSASLLLAVSATSFAAPPAQPAPTPTAAPAAKKEVKDIVDTAIAAGNFKTLAKALQAADLVQTLKGKGPFTVFAPTDDAFAKLPPGTLEALLNDIPKLKAILTYHVVAGKVTAAQVATLKKAKTVNGASVTLDSKAGVKVNGATVTAADIEATNGVIHVIDAVILPPEKGSAK